jgi:hypothetical protein
VKSIQCHEMVTHRRDILDRHCIARFDVGRSEDQGECGRGAESVGADERESQSSL